MRRVFVLDSVFKVFLERKDSGERILYAMEDPRYLLRQKNGVIVLCNSETRAQGILSPDGGEIWQLEGRESLGEGFPLVRFVTMAEYDEWEALREGELRVDPEDTEPQIPENVEPETVLTRAELTEKVNNLEEAIGLLLSGEVD